MFKKLFAAASIMAISSAFLVSPVANAAEIVTNPIPYYFNYIYCQGLNIGKPNTKTIYVLIQSKAMSDSNCARATAVIIPDIAGHTTSYDLTKPTIQNPNPSIVATNIKLTNNTLSPSNVVKSCDGANTILTVTDLDGDGMYFTPEYSTYADITIINNTTDSAKSSPFKLTLTKNTKNLTNKETVRGKYNFSEQLFNYAEGTNYSLINPTGNFDITVDVELVCNPNSGLLKPVLIGLLPTDLTTFCNAGFARSPSSESKKRVINKSGTNVTSIDCPYKSFNPKEPIVIKNYSPDIICRYFNQASYDKLYKSGSVAKITETKVKNKTSYNCYF
jgi:hypothetical protein